MKYFLSAFFVFLLSFSWSQAPGETESPAETIKRILTDPKMSIADKAYTLHVSTPPIWTKISAEEFQIAESAIKERILFSTNVDELFHLNSILSNAYGHRGDISKSITHAEACVRLAREMGDKEKEFSANGLIIWMYLHNGMDGQVIPYTNDQMRLSREMGKDSIYAEAVGLHGFMLMGLAMEKKDTMLLDSAANFLKQRYDYLSKYKGESFQEASIGYAMALARTGQHQQAIDVNKMGYQSAFNIRDEYWKMHWRARFAQQIGHYYVILEEKDSAFHYLDLCLEVDNEIIDTTMAGAIFLPDRGIYAYCVNIYFLTNAYELFGEYERARYYLMIALADKRFREQNPFYSVILEAAARVSYKQKKYDQAVRYFIDLNKMKDSLQQIEIQNYMGATEAHTESQILQEKKYAELENEKQLLITQQEKEKRTFITIVFTIGAIVLIIMLTLIYRRFKITSKQKTIIESQKVLVEKAYDELDEKNKEITDSIKYAKRIQAAILPTDKRFNESLKDAFILYKPKDIVAGDFYWLQENKEHILIAAADCTGHGVPGALVSVVCNNALNRSVREFGLSDPGKILDKTREIVIAEFEKSDENVKDGMDISLCSLSLSTRTLNWAGANNPLWIMRNNELIEYKANKQPIGKFDNPHPYTTHSVSLESGDIIYIFTDGFIDQFGGEKGKKLKTKGFETLLQSIHELPMTIQKAKLDEAFENWRGTLEQIDDVCVIGVRVR